MKKCFSLKSVSAFKAVGYNNNLWTKFVDFSCEHFGIVSSFGKLKYPHGFFFVKNVEIRPPVEPFKRRDTRLYVKHPGLISKKDFRMCLKILRKESAKRG